MIKLSLKKSFKFFLKLFFKIFFSFFLFIPGFFNRTSEKRNTLFVPGFQFTFIRNRTVTFKPESWYFLFVSEFSLQNSI
ncbi:hypothetical protein MSWHS_1611 [Methanosarcina sp. WWM596]|nr:hypothetical protein MSWHS_1611 [Methanosarcina sp. WWM596]AKB21973.1 hypothetical protein MSWH1_1702 [Methanosarcina sp. WH1]